MKKYPDTNAVLVRRHGVYVWGGKFFFFNDCNSTLCINIVALESWEKAKTMTECYDYLFEIAVKMKSIGIDPAVKPASEPDYC